MSDNTNNTSEEVDLGKLFKLIGDGFRNMFKAIGNFFGRIFNFLIISLIFLKKHFIKIAVASLLGAGIGYFLEKKTKQVYQSDLIIETNFGSGHELYNQTNNLNSLVEREEYDKLASIFDISKEEAETISGFSIEPFEKEINLIKEFEYYKQHTDTIFTRELTPAAYAKRLQDEDYRLQKITAFSKEQTIFNKLNNGISKLAHNKHFEKLLNIKNTELKNKKNILNKNLIEIDSLRKVYKEVALLSAKNTNANGTNINFSDKKAKDSPDMDLFKQTNSILYQLRDVNKEIIRSGFITNTIAEFELGYIDNELLSEKWKKYGVLAGLLMILGILALQFNTYLDNYKKKE